jgi:glycosyltransferase involved in cell wall biosynthesis
MSVKVYIRDYPALDDYGYDYQQLFSDYKIYDGKKIRKELLVNEVDCLILTGFYDFKILFYLFFSRSKKIILFPFCSLHSGNLRSNEKFLSIFKFIYQLIITIKITLDKRILVSEFDPSVCNWKHSLFRKRVFFHQLPLKGYDEVFTLTHSNTLFFNGRMDIYQKGLDVLVDQFSNFKVNKNKSNLKLIISGKKPPEKRYQKNYYSFLKKIKHNELIDYRGFLSLEDRSKLFEDNNNIFTYTSRFDGTARPIREAAILEKDFFLSMGTGLSCVPFYNSSRFLVSNKYPLSYINGFMCLEFDVNSVKSFLTCSFQKQIINYFIYEKI